MTRLSQVQGRGERKRLLTSQIRATSTRVVNHATHNCQQIKSPVLPLNVRGLKIEGI